MFLTLSVKEGSEDAVRDLLTGVSGFTRSVAFREPDEHLICVFGIGSGLWDRLYPDLPKPKGLHPFEEIKGDKHTAVATQEDLLIHLRAGRLDMCFELAHLIARKFGDHVTIVDEVHGFKFFDERDLLGFVDGTENPEAEKAVETVTIGDEDKPYAGGSYVIIQKYLHDMSGWEALSTEQQEDTIGRSKVADIEMDDDEKPANAHIKLNVIHDADGKQLKIVRDNMPFGSVGEKEFGTFFIGYAKDPSVTERMLRNMFIGDPPGTYDRILDFSTPKTGALFFVPSVDFLDDPTPRG